MLILQLEATDNSIKVHTLDPPEYGGSSVAHLAFAVVDLSTIALGIRAELVSKLATAVWYPKTCPSTGLVIHHAELR